MMSMEYTQADLAEAKRQIDSTLHKLRETVKTLEGKERPERYRAQITLARRRIRAFEIALRLIRRELAERFEDSQEKGEGQDGGAFQGTAEPGP